ncbi:MAG: hypothetical protein JWO06_483 [Bacteroidota bacterium]|nr:hypothetical protein [Bacteroidota bacterium]
MITVTAYNTPGQFLDDTEQILEQRELENNLMIGLCNNFPDRTRQYKNCVFINAVEDGNICASSIKTISKAVISCNSNHPEHIKALAQYYLANNIQLTGAVGETFHSTAFTKFYGGEEINRRGMIVHRLTTVNQLPMSPGSFEVATQNDLDLITQWTLNFEEDTGTFPKATAEQVKAGATLRINNGVIFKWIDNNEIVSIAAIVRKTKNVGFLGLVYTPPQWRGKGYATTIVQILSRHILQQGYKYCGLFTDISNPVTNHIYKRIGYVSSTEFTDIEYKTKT